MGLISIGQTCDFIPNNILNYRVFRKTESHENTIIYGKSVLLNKLSDNCKEKYRNNVNRNIYRWPIMADILPYYSHGRWDFTDLGGDVTRNINWIEERKAPRCQPGIKRYPFCTVGIV